MTMYHEVAKGREKLLGPMHQYTISSWFNIDCFFYCQGKHEDAKPLLNTVLRDRTEVLGALHGETLTTKLMVAQNLYKLKEYNETLRLAEEV